MSKDKKYNKKRQLKAVSFLKEEHAEILEYANSLDDFSGAVRDLLQREIDNEKTAYIDDHGNICNRCGFHQD